MSDVRLTATNPEDSSVVPVACNAKGELKLEEPIAPPEFDGNLDGDLSVTGSATFAERVTTGSNTVPGLALSVENNNANAATIYARNYGADGGPVLYITDSTGNETARIDNNGSASFSGFVNIGSSSFTAIGEQITNNSGALPCLWLQNSASPGPLLIGYSSGSKTVEINNDGSVNFAGNKAGFTADGYLWCTTRRGSTVILDATSNGMGAWADYTPPTRAEQAKERIDALKQPRDESDNSHRKQPRDESDNSHRDEAVTP